LKESVMNTSKLVARAVVVTLVGFGTPALAQNASTYPAGSIFLQDPIPYAAPSRAQQPVAPVPPQSAARPAERGALNPLDAPEAGNVWKPSNRDAGNLAVQRWDDYAARQKALSQPR
jgi:hypothetical protein